MTYVTICDDCVIVCGFTIQLRGGHHEENSLQFPIHHNTIYNLQSTTIPFTLYNPQCHLQFPIHSKAIYNLQQRAGSVAEGKFLADCAASRQLETTQKNRIFDLKRIQIEKENRAP